MDRNYESMETAMVQMLLSSGRDLQWVVEQLKAGRKIHSRPIMRVNLDEQIEPTSRSYNDSGSPHPAPSRANQYGERWSTAKPARKKQPAELQYKQKIQMFGGPQYGANDVRDDRWEK